MTPSHALQADVSAPEVRDAHKKRHGRLAGQHFTEFTEPHAS